MPANEDPNDETTLHERITTLTAQQHALRDEPGVHDEQHLEQIAALTVEIDRSWDLLRQREALLHAGKDPDDASQRPAGEVEGYLQ